MEVSARIARFLPAVWAPLRRLAALGGLSLLGMFSPSGRAMPIDASLANFSSQLPVLVLGRDETNPTSLALFTADDNTPTFLATPLVSAATASPPRDSASSASPKKSYTLQLRDADGAPVTQSLLGLAPDDTWQLVSPWNYDRAFFRTAFVYSLTRSLGRWAPRTKFVEVFVASNHAPVSAGDYAGISVLTERVTTDLAHLNLTPLPPSATATPEITGGYLLKIASAHPGDFAFTTPHLAEWAPASSLIVQEPAAPNLSDPQRDYIRGYVQAMESALYADAMSGWTTHKHLVYLDRASWVDAHLLQVLAGNVEAFQHCFYFFKDRDGKLAAGPPASFEHTFGSADPRNSAWDKWSAPDAVDFWNYGWWGLLTRDPDFMQAWIDRWQQLRRKELSDDTLALLASNLAAQIGPEAAARDAARWPDDASRYDDNWAGEVAQLKSWAIHRATWIDGKFVAPPRLETDGILLSVTAPAGAKLIYTLDGSDPRGPNGQMALTARTTAGPLVVDASSLLCVRAWNPTADTFPGSPWSAPLTKANAHSSDAERNPAFQTRLANLSSFVHLSPTSGAPLTGLVITGTTEKQILVRAVGPGLRQFGLTGILPDPTIAVLDGRGRELARNTRWNLGANALDLPGLSANVGAFQLAADSADSALVLRLGPGSYTIVVSSASRATGTALAEVYELDRAGSLASLATCATIDPANPMLAGGFVVRGGSPQKFLVRAVGPGLAALGITGTLADPVITIAAATGLIARNDNWPSAEPAADGTTTVTAATACGAFALPPGSADAALVVTLAPGSYTAQVTGHGGATGLVLLEVYGVP